MQKWMIFGADTWQGKQLIRIALLNNLQPILSGANYQAVIEVALRTNLEARLVDFKNTEEVDYFLSDIHALVNCRAAEFGFQEEILLACNKKNVTYMDLASGSVDIFNFIKISKKVPLLIPALSCFNFQSILAETMSTQLKQYQPNCTNLKIAFSNSLFMAYQKKQIVLSFFARSLFQRNGKMKSIPSFKQTSLFYFSKKPTLSSLIPHASTSLCWFSTKIQNIETYKETNAKQMKFARLLPILTYLTYIPFLKKLIKNQLIKAYNGCFSSNQTSPTIFVEGCNNENEKIWIKIHIKDIFKTQKEVFSKILKSLLFENLQSGTFTPSMLFPFEQLLAIEGVFVETSWQKNTES